MECTLFVDGNTEIGHRITLPEKTRTNWEEMRIPVAEDKMTFGNERPTRDGEYGHVQVHTFKFSAIKGPDSPQ